MTRRKRAPVEISFAEEKLDWFAFRVYVYAFWAVAAARTENRPKLRKMRERLLATLDRAPEIGRVTADRPATYDPEEQLLFVNARERERVTGLKGDSARLYFAPYRDFAKLVHSYGDAHAPGVHLDLRTIDLVDRNHLRDFGWITRTVPDRGAVVVDSNDNGATIWITTDRTNAGFSKDAAFAADEYIRTPTAKERWLDQINNLEVAMSAAFARDALSILVEHYELPIPAPRPTEDIHTILVTSGRSDVAKHFTKGSASHVWVMTRNEAVTLRQLRKLNATRLRHVVIVTPHVVLALVQLNPALWSKYFGNAANFAVVQPSDVERLGKLLLPSWTQALRDRFRAYVESAASAAAPQIATILATEPRFPRREYKKNPECHERLFHLAHEVDAWLQQFLTHPRMYVADEIFRSLGWYHAKEHNAWIETFVERVTAAVMAAYDRRFFPIVAWHHELQQPLQELAVFMRVVGRKESGKSTALYHAASGHKGDVIVIGGRTGYQRTVLATDDDVAMIRRIIRSVSGDWLIIIDGAELENGKPTATTTLAKVLDLAYRENDASRSTRIRVFSAASSLHTDSSLFSYRRLASRYMDLNVLDTNLVHELLGTWIATYEIDITAERHDRLLGTFSAAEAGRTARGTPADIGQWTVGEIVQRLRTVSSKTVTDHDVERLIAR